MNPIAMYMHSVCLTQSRRWIDLICNEDDDDNENDEDENDFGIIIINIILN